MRAFIMLRAGCGTAELEQWLEISGPLNEHGMESFLCLIVSAETGERDAESKKGIRVVAGLLYQRAHRGQGLVAPSGPVKRFGIQETNGWFGTVHVGQIGKRLRPLLVVYGEARELQVGVRMLRVDLDQFLEIHA